MQKTDDRWMSHTITGGIAALVASSPILAEAQEKTLRFGLWIPPRAAMYTEGLVPWTKAIERASGGSLRIQMYPAQQLGGAADHYDMAVRGIADITFVNPGYTPGRFPILGATELPLLVSEAVGGSVAIYEWYSKYAALEMQDTKACIHYVHKPGTIHSKEPVRVPTDLRGLRVRPGQPTIARFVASLGGANISVDAPATREALARGTADAVTFPWGGLRVFGIDKVVLRHLDMPLYVTNAFVVVGKRSYEGLSDAHKKAVDSVCNAGEVERIAGIWEMDERTAYEAIKADSRHSLHTPTGVELEKWREAAKPFYADWIRQMDESGLRGKEMFDELRALLKARNALAGF